MHKTSLRIRYINSTKHRFKTRERIVFFFFYEFQQPIIIITVEQWTVLFIVNIVVNRSKTGQARRKEFKQMLHGSVLAA